MSRYVGSKWTKTVAIRKQPFLAQYVPETSRMTKQSLRRQLLKYRMVYVKPEFGMHGNGVMRVEQLDQGYRYQLGNTIRTYEEFDSLYRGITSAKRRGRYLVQKGIHLLKHNGRRFDLRVMTQYTPKKQWVTTGIIGRVAAKRKIVTNYHSGGQILTAEKLLHSHTERVQTKLELLSKLGVAAGQAMGRSFPGVRMIGLDVALDQSLNPWVLEVNTSPDPHIFRKHPNKQIYRSIMKLIRKNAR
ncbi:YheC/YheD family protein [Paenibacillus sp. CF384]|uniref:YheC/YheD family protein n=1 Tax=Paenibacillus sp. CF384 TaxID=1884382 RepID=UPI00089A34B1|nr:YheC/YheD family protein [Paenibacillus sp. CF384]SDW16184.1 YheC/D like ATP-grasp [Paenibacillus sp. CF384]